ncbi:hypothetical protein [Glaciecola sp. KUL10]|uniref:hypothetical protein n=1 Tax=Glaciecola sp. (strain KUL10) TaxID=2161813 RepID=UPI000D7840F6|nr:hypothetical protein [Glaciecola sp. KUL10]GBL04696.1 hypothetical protein KUL10_20050 [Glaciecola sp. KUL10]
MKKRSKEVTFDIYVFNFLFFTPHFWLVYLALPLGVTWSIKAHIIEYQIALQWLASALICCGSLWKAISLFQVELDKHLTLVNTSELTEKSRVTPFFIFANFTYDLHSSSEKGARWLIIYPWQCSPPNYRRLCRQILKIQL